MHSQIQMHVRHGRGPVPAEPPQPICLVPTSDGSPPTMYGKHVPHYLRQSHEMGRCRYALLAILTTKYPILNGPAPVPLPVPVPLLVNE